MNRDELSKLSNEELSTLAAKKQGWDAHERHLAGAGHYLSYEAHYHDLMKKAAFSQNSYSPPTNLQQAAELFMGMIEEQQKKTLIFLSSEKWLGPNPLNLWVLIFRDILNPEDGARNLTIACLAAMV